MLSHRFSENARVEIRQPCVGPTVRSGGVGFKASDDEIAGGITLCKRKAVNARLAKRLRKPREPLLRLVDPNAIDATNNLAEREIRPAVIARKLSAGDQTEAGAETHASVMRTCYRQHRHILGARATTVVSLSREALPHIILLLS